MKGLFKQIGQKLTEAVDSVANYTADVSHATGVHVSATSRTGKDAVARSLDQADPSCPVLQHLLRNVRSRHVRQHFFSKPASSYTHQKDVRITVGSYNVNGKKPPADLNLHEWLGLAQGCWPAGSAGDAEGDAPDILALGFQEIVPLNASNVIVGSATANLEAWDKAIGTYLNGDAWAAQQYGGAAGDSLGMAGSVSVGSAMDAQWQGAPPPGPAPAAEADRQSGAGPGMQAEWLQVAARQLVGTYVSVWVRRSVLQHVKGVQATHTATGFGGYLGNKGAVVVRMRVYDSPLLLVCSHLSAGEQEGDELRRNSDVTEILRRTDFTVCGDGPGSMAAPSAALLSGSLGIGHWGFINSILDHHNVIWMGDLNYRLMTSALSDEEVHKALRAGDLQPLLASDQLLREMAAGRVFQGWKEGHISFPPTFKFKVGTHTYLGDPGVKGSAGGGGGGDAAGGGGDWEPDEAAPGGKQKRRTPAWCDRVLWLDGQGLMRQVCYKRSEVTASDHKPVLAAFVLKARHYDRPCVEAGLQEARKAVDQLAAMQRPKCVLEPNQVHVSSVLSHADVSRHVVTLTNSGSVEGMWHFISPPGLDALDSDCPPLPAWLRALPAEGVVPGDGGQVDITLEVCVEGGAGGAAAGLGPAGAQAALEAIVILRIEDGGDKFLCVNGSCQLSFLGHPVSRLTEQDVDNSKDTSAQETCGHLIKQGCSGLPYLSTRLQARVQAQHPEFSLLSLTSPAALGSLIPSQWRALLAGLLAQETALETPGLCVRSACHVIAEQPAGELADKSLCDGAVWCDRLMVRRVIRQLGGLRDAVQAGQEPGPAEPHSAAALLFAALVELPQPLIPLQLTELCNIQELNQLKVDRVLGSSMHPPDAALLCAVLALLSRLPACSAIPAGVPASSLEPGSPLQLLCEVASAVLMRPARAGEAADAEARRQLLMAQLLYHTRTH